MSDALILELARGAVTTAAMVAAPMLLAALLVGLVVSIVQAVTQIQEQTLSFAPKLLTVAVVFLATLPWMLQLLVRYAAELFRSLPALAS